MTRFTFHAARFLPGRESLPAFAWRGSWRRVGWLPAAGSAGLLLFLLLAGQAEWGVVKNLIPPVRVVEMILPLVAGIQAAFLFSPEDESPLELLLSSGRSLPWLLLERLLVLLGMYAAAGGLITLAQWLLLEDASLAALLLRWLPPLCWLVGIAVFFTLLTRQGTLSALLALLTWGGFLLSGSSLIAYCRMLLPLHLFLQPDLPGTSAAMYGYNRGMLLLSSGAMIAFAAGLSREEPRLLGEKGWNKMRRRRPRALPDRLSFLWLILGLFFFFLMQPGQPVAMWAAWLAPLLLLRFTRTQHPDPGLLIAVGATAAVSYAAWLEKTLLNDLCHAVFAGQQAITFMLPFVVDRLLWPRWRGRFAGTLVLPAAWVVAETATALFNVTVGSAGSIAYSQARFLPLLQLTAVTGITGVSFLIAWLASVANWAWELAGNRYPVSGNQYSVIGKQLPTYQSPITDPRLPIPDYRSPIPDYRLPAKGLLVYLAVLFLVTGSGWVWLRFFPPQGETIAVTGFSLPQADWLFQGEKEAAAEVDYFAGAERQLRVQVPTSGVQTIYGRFGSWFAWLCLAVLLTLMVTGIKRGAKENE